ncbi:MULTISPECIES: molybdopterin converting factor subunit 1 [Mammaliicoccus]|jgi:molybdopterin synthase sulfur carrier subunit|uniref:Molybdopterin synthase sulfur carrier subunit n=1 Tax=Mammaliicoccus lentus TaxID=42858 RepID=A0ABS6GY75_MAMLE|nr:MULTISPECIES: molybdopterin converting factor subunit 1 [Mammaliicoccus]HBV04788.1 molybdopterin converting factor subunit 1 [Staphylococcus sp.]MBF0748240.1 molybdopterin converting factor subunit 1 [Mammaliicoccus lentus]MBF0794117.1 molybdopterin converting factor subunit 1 [Mammaliicoccus lentus]MBF0842801.1 molybdopterin converting factor subunit 1 [Mammaliicoccus lentus]MBU6113150.1 molybdopterin converting factor subunit 1 [Mammaliicoccus lentus]
MKVLYFAHLKELLNKKEEQITLNKTYSVLEFKQYLFENYPELKGEIFQIAVNEEFVQDDDTITSDATVALIPPVSGG